MEEIEKIRKKIDQIDRNLGNNLKKRLQEIKKIAKLKKTGKWPKKSVKDKEREEKILSKLETDFEIEIFKKILTESRKYQKGSLTRKG